VPEDIDDVEQEVHGALFAVRATSATALPDGVQTALSSGMSVAAAPRADRVALVTGANSGIGLWTARALAARGATVIFAGRSEDKNRAAMAEVERATGNPRLEFLPCDLGSLASVRAAADTFIAPKRWLHLLINNAGLGGGITDDTFELDFGTNHLGRFLLTGYFERERPKKPSRAARDPALQQALWDDSVEAVGPFLR
jgi:NAD(P)-dependent dehydrogenase (short-subunit alcohol dehydrogenase family)